MCICKVLLKLKISIVYVFINWFIVNLIIFVLDRIKCLNYFNFVGIDVLIFIAWMKPYAIRPFSLLTTIAIMGTSYDDITFHQTTCTPKGKVIRSKMCLNPANSTIRIRLIVLYFDWIIIFSRNYLLQSLNLFGYYIFDLIFSKFGQLSSLSKCLKPIIWVSFYLFRPI